MTAINKLKDELTNLGYGTQIKTPKSLATKVVEIVPVIGRIETFNDIAEKLDKYNALYQDDQEAIKSQIGARGFSSSVGGIIFPQSEFADLAVKVIKGGAGSKPSTAEHETYSALCFGAKLKNKATNYELADLQEASSFVDSSKNDPDRLFTTVMTSDWKLSSANQAEAFFKKMAISSTNYTIERQQEGPITEFLYKRAGELIEELTKNSTQFQPYAGLQLDKWNPGDIWLVRNDVTKALFNPAKTIKHLNEIIYELYLDKKLISVSLKKWDKKTEAPIEVYNAGARNYFGKYVRHDLGISGGFSFTNNNLSLHYEMKNTSTKPGSAIVRPFTGTDVSAEIEGVAAAGGKVGRTFINKVLSSMGVQQIVSYKDIIPVFDKDPMKIRTDFYNEVMKSKYAPKNMKINDFIKEVQKKYNTIASERAYINAKYQAASFANALESLSPSKRDEVVDKLITFAASSIEDVSSVFVKVGK
jgi:DNA-directed RNA polymerase subunit F